MKPMLAGKFDESKVEKKLPLLGQLKYDGIRVFIRDGYAYTRSLKPVRSQELQSWVRNNSDFLEGLDGEIICGEPTAPDCYRRTMQFVMSYDAPDEFVFYVFDKWDEPSAFRDRFAVVEEICSSFIMEKGPKRIQAAETRTLLTMHDVWKFHDEMVEQGQEGIILRDPDSFYKYGRGSPVKCECIKMKEGGWIDTEVRIVGFTEKMHNGNEATINELGYTEHSGHKENLVPMNTLGALEVEGNFEDGTPFSCQVGTGFDDVTRDAVWFDRQSHITKLAKIKYFSVGIKDKPRFPVFLGFRDPDDMDPEQLDLF
jgi:DNA ligase-1